MIQLSLESLNAIERGERLKYGVKVYFSVPELYTEDDYLQSVGAINCYIYEGNYSIANTSITLRNKEFYFSRRFAQELPSKRFVEIFGIIRDESILLFTGIINNWTLTRTQLQLDVTA